MNDLMGLHLSSTAWALTPTFLRETPPVYSAIFIFFSLFFVLFYVKNDCSQWCLTERAGSPEQGFTLHRLLAWSYTPVNILNSHLSVVQVTSPILELQFFALKIC